MPYTDMTKPVRTNPKLTDWVPLEQQIQTCTAVRDLFDLVPEVKAPQQFADDIF